MTTVLNFVCDRTPDQNGCRFIECENEHGESIKAGEWRLRDDGLVELRVALSQQPKIDALEATVAEQAKMIEHLRGGPTPLYTAVDMANAARDGLRDGAASHWQSMDTCPKHVDVLFFHARNGVIAGRLTDADSFMTDKERDEFDGSEEEQFAIDAFGFGHWGVDRMDGTEAPTHWMPYPPEPEVQP